jgi:hypothetical protein
MMPDAADISASTAQPSAPATGEAEALDLAGVARFLNVGMTTAKSMRLDGRLPSPNLTFSRVHRWSVIELRAWLLAGAPGRALWSRIRTERIRDFLRNGLRAASA